MITEIIKFIVTRRTHLEVNYRWWGVKLHY